jgi:putative ABC transport system ATP-binding protein
MSLFSKPKNGNGTSNGYMIDLHEVHKYYKTPIGDFHALNSIDLQIYPGEFVSIIGKSGSGKSTLLNMITGIDRPTTGEVYVNGQAVHELNENRMARWRGKNLGIVFQFFQLLPTISVIENIMLPMDFCRTYPMREREKRASNCSKWSNWLSTPTSCPRLSPAGSSNASRSHAPSPTIRLS